MENAPLILLAFLIAGTVKGVVGLGLPAIAIALLTIVLAPPEAAALIVVPSILTNLWQAWAGPDFRGLLKRLAPLLIGTVLGVTESRVSQILTRATERLRLKLKEQE